MNKSIPKALKSSGDMIKVIVIFSDTYTFISIANFTKKLKNNES